MQYKTVQSMGALHDAAELNDILAAQVLLDSGMDMEARHEIVCETNFADSFFCSSILPQSIRSITREIAAIRWQVCNKTHINTVRFLCGLKL